MLKPITDFAMLEISADEYGFEQRKESEAESGILVKLPEKLTHYSFYSMAFEDALMNEEKLSAILDYWKPFVRQRVYWLAMSERGAMLKYANKRYAFVKLTSLYATSEPDEQADAVIDVAGGSFV